MFVPGKPFQLSLMFLSKARAYPSEVPFIFSTLGYLIFKLSAIMLNVVMISVLMLYAVMASIAFYNVMSNIVLLSVAFSYFYAECCDTECPLFVVPNKNNQGFLSIQWIRQGSLTKGEGSVQSGHINCRGKLSTVDLLIKVACFVKN